jgi:hypothetical protein
LKAQPFAVSDKVKLARLFVCPKEGVVPRLKHGRLYCVRELSVEADGQQLIRLVGVMCTKDGSEAWLRGIHFTAPAAATRQKGDA